MESWKIVERDNPLAVHGYFYSRASAEKHLRETIPNHCRWGFFTDKALTPDDFIVLPRTNPDTTPT